METITQIFGWIGTAVIIIAYLLVSYKKVDGSNKYYQLMNLLGAACVGLNVFYQKAWPALTLQIVWGIIAISSLLTNKNKKN